jgi:hypothetical protein
MFKAGKFAEAGKAYAGIAAREAANLTSQLRLGQIALLANRLDQAQVWLKKVPRCSVG